MQFFSDFRQACHLFKNRLAAVDILDRVDYLSYVTERLSCDMLGLSKRGVLEIEYLYQNMILNW